MKLTDERVHRILNRALLASLLAAALASVVCFFMRDWIRQVPTSSF